jgi:hypothetical protein
MWKCRCEHRRQEDCDRLKCVEELEAENAELRQIVTQFVKATQVEQEPVGLFHYQEYGGWQQCCDKTLEEWRKANDEFLECDRSTREPSYLYLHPAPIPEGMARWKGLLVQDVGFSYIDRKYIPSVLLSFAEDDFDTRDAFVAAAQGVER